MGFLAIFLGTGLLLFAHRLARIGVPRGSLSATEAFILGHWPFIIVNAFVVYLSGGKSWGRVEQIGVGPFLGAAGLIALGLVSFLGGGLVAVKHCGRRPARDTRLYSSHRFLLVLAITLVLVGGWATWSTHQEAVMMGLGRRSNELLVLSQLLLPGAIAAWLVARTGPHLGWRVSGWSIVALALVSLSWQWTRRPLLVAVAAIVMGAFFLRSGVISRRALYLSIPALAAIAVGMMVWRVSLTFGFDLRELTSPGDLASWYLERVWLDASAYSALSYLVANFDLAEPRFNGHILAPFLVWLPRSVFPEKPVGFELGEILGVPYSLPATVYGEIAYDLTFLAVVPVMAAIGYLIKRVDLRVSAGGLPPITRMLYLVFVFDVIFLVRGSFNTMVIPILIHCVVPLLLLKGVTVLTAGVRRKSAVRPPAVRGLVQGPGHRRPVSPNEPWHR